MAEYKRMGVIAGNFDVVHPGYIKMFKECKANCDIFVVLLHSDPTIERPEKIKPILSVAERDEMLMSIKYVDNVFTYDTEADLLHLLNILQPSVRFLGDDYKDRSFTGKDLKIPIHYLDRSHGWSTTKFKKLIAKSILN